MTPQQIKELTDDQILDLIDDPNDTHFDQMKELIRNDIEFRSRIQKLKDQNGNDELPKTKEQLIKTLQAAILKAPDGFKPHLQATLDRLTGKVQDDDWEEFLNNGK